MRNRYRLLSYHLSVDTARYGGDRPFTIKEAKDISKGDSCNTFNLNLPNHIGTHIDCPNHFYDSGKRISQYKIRDFIFSRPVILDCPKGTDGLITEDDIKKNEGKLKGKDILLLRTGFYKYRGSDRYSAHNPGVDPGAARFIRTNFTNIKSIGIDCVSISPYSCREMGRETHRIFLKKDSFKSQPVCVIEDMDLSGKLDNLRQVFVVPLFIKGVDSSLCTVLGSFKEAA